MTDKSLADNIKKLKPGPSFIVQGKNARISAVRVAWNMKRCGTIDFDIATRSIGKGQFKVTAV